MRLIVDIQFNEEKNEKITQIIGLDEKTNEEYLIASSTQDEKTMSFKFTEEIANGGLQLGCQAFLDVLQGIKHREDELLNK